jgi:putative phage-type endonuclease|nr:MAG TPA: Exonuclease [Caudoviricetes sp.]
MKTTLKFKDRAEWLQSRTLGIGASEVGTILGLNPFETPYQLYLRKKGKVAPKPENEAMRMGHLLEDAVAQRFAIETGVHIIKNTTDDFTVFNNERPYMRVSPDRLYWGQGVKHNEANKGVLECKTTAMPVDVDNVPKHWFCQLQYQLGVCEYTHGAIAWIYLGRREFGMLPTEFDPEFFEYLVEQVDEFWTRYIVGNEEPAAYNVEDVVMKFPRHTIDKRVTATDDLIAETVQLKELNEQLKEIKAKKESLEENIKLAMGDAEALVTPDETVLATWKAPKPSSKFDAKTFKDKYPQLYAKYCKEAQGARRFLLK